MSISLMLQALGECCGDLIEVSTVCQTSESDLTQNKKLICYDGDFVDGTYCGVGSCNLFGCNCNGGCRRNSKGFSLEEAKEIFKAKYLVNRNCPILAAKQTKRLWK